MWKPARVLHEVQVLRYNFPTEERKQRPHSVQNRALNEALRGWAHQPLPVSKFLTKLQVKEQVECGFFFILFPYSCLSRNGFRGLFSEGFIR